MGKWTSLLIIGLTLTFLIGPFFIIIAAGLSAGENLAFPPEGLSLKWYWAVFEVESFRESFALSMFLAVFGTLSALVLGVPAAFYIDTQSWRPITVARHRQYASVCLGRP